jgi:PEP-CTERM motif
MKCVGKPSYGLELALINNYPHREESFVMKLRKTTLLIVVAALAVMATPVLAQDACQSVAGNLIVNCGFETGNFSGWTLSANTGFTGVSSAYAFSGSYGAFLGPVGSDGYLSQSFWGNTLSFQFRQDPSYWGLDSTSATFFGSCGAGCGIYYIDFWLYSPGGTPNDFTVLWNGVDVGPSLVDAGAFAYTDFNGYVYGNTPEPGSLILLGSGALGLAGVLRRKLMQ